MLRTVQLRPTDRLLRTAATQTFPGASHSGRGDILHHRSFQFGRAPRPTNRFLQSESDVLEPLEDPPVKEFNVRFGLTKREFTDKLQVVARAGRGGRGCSSFKKWGDGKRAPDGAQGGRGGSIWLEVTNQLHQLDHLPGKIQGEDGERGRPERAVGANGKDVARSRTTKASQIDDEMAENWYKLGAGASQASVKEERTSDLEDRHIPIEDSGLVYPSPLATREYRARLVADLDRPGQRILICRGGEGGRGNASFRDSNYRRFNRYSEAGGPGEIKRLILELKLIADCSLVGFPNAGKSSLLAAVTNARPKIANYPFTTLTPSVAVAEVGDRALNRITVADIPGLIHGAHLDKGLGHDFLRHIERTRILVYLVDISEEDGRSAVSDLEHLRTEIGLYSEKLLDHPSLIFANKADLLPEELVQEQVTALQEVAPDWDILSGSAKTGAGTQELVQTLFQRLQRMDAAELGAAEALDPSLEAAEAEMYNVRM